MFISLVDKYFKDNHDFQICIQNITNEEIRDSLESLIFTIEDIFDTELLMKKQMAENTKNNLHYIKQGVSQELDDKREQLAVLDNLLEEVNQSISDKLQFKPERMFKHFSTYRTTLIPQFGYYVEVKLKSVYEFERDIINSPDYPKLIKE